MNQTSAGTFRETRALRAWRLRDAAGQRLRDAMAEASAVRCPLAYGEALRLARGEYSSWLARIDLALACGSV